MASRSQHQTAGLEAGGYVISGMSCEHCAAAVRDEVAAVAGVSSVEVDLASGAMVVVGSAAEPAVLAAVAEAGYSAEAAS